jgi:hypothetical protein
MQMQPLDALWGTKFYTDQSHWPLLIVRLFSLLIRSSIFSKLLKTGKNETYVIPLSSLDPQRMRMNLQYFLFYVVQPCILISPKIVSPQAVVINYQNINKRPRWFTLPSAKLWHSTKKLLCRVFYIWHSVEQAVRSAILGHSTKFFFIFFIFPTKLFVVCSYTMQTYMYHFDTIIKVFSITIRFSSFNRISSKNWHLNCKSLETWKIVHVKMICMLFSTSYDRF